VEGFWRLVGIKDYERLAATVADPHEMLLNYLEAIVLTTTTTRPLVSSNGCPSRRAHTTTACPTHDLGASKSSAMILLYLAFGPNSRQEITLAALEIFCVCLVSPDGLRRIL
jgi:hypothetical protein